MGEIGFQRREFLYDIQFWEVRRIVRGYRRRNKLILQLLAENVYASTFAFRGSNGKTPKDMFPALFDDEENIVSAPPMTKEEAQELQDMMKEMNQKGEAF